MRQLMARRPFRTAAAMQRRDAEAVAGRLGRRAWDAEHRENGTMELWMEWTERGGAPGAWAVPGADVEKRCADAMWTRRRAWRDGFRVGLRVGLRVGFRVGFRSRMWRR